MAASVVNLKKPSATDLSAADNCTTTSNLDISWKRTYESSTTQDLSAPFKVGTTNIEWIVRDETGNSSSCYQKVEVLDEVGPVFDCTSLVDLKLNADSDGEAKPNAVVAAGLIIPETAYDEEGSPTGSTIKGVGTRSDGKGVFADAYPLGTTTITWTFTDASNNKTTCMQNVIVADKMPPVYANCNLMADVLVQLGKEECVASLEKVATALGKHSAEDNLSGTIYGEPFLRLSDGSLTALLNSFTPKKYDIVWVFKDEAGNTTQCNQKLILKNNLLEIETVADLEALRNGVNTGEEFNYKGVAVPAGGEGIFFKLTADLDLGSVCGKNVKGSEVSWIPIGTDYAKSFKGYFDGCGHSISNLYINEPSKNVQGFFGYIVGANVKNLQLVSTDITASNNVGGVFGYANEKSSISNCANSGSIIGADNVGGICGVVSGGVTIEKCTNSGSVKGEDLTGGIIGNIVASAIDNCINSSSVKCTSSKTGGICGYDEAAEIRNSYYDKQMCVVGGINSNDALGSAEGRLTSELTNGSLFNDPTSWVEAEGLYPRPAGIASTDAAIVAATPLFLHVDVADNTKYESANAVATDFTVNADNSVIWSADNMSGTATVNGNGVTLTKNGEVALILTKGLATKRIPLTITKKPIIADISAPSSVIHGDNLVLTTPTVNDYGTAATGRWEIEGASTYKTFGSPYTVRYADNGKRLRYVSENEYGTIYSNVVSITVVQKQLTATTPIVTATKPYDGTANAAITDAGSLENVVDGDVVSFKAIATYENESIGVNKTITVTYEIDGADAGNYLTPVNYSIKTGEIIGKTEVGTISAPESVCSGNSLTLIEPNVNTWGLTFVGKWEMSGDNFATVTEYTGQVLKEEYDGWKLRYVAETNIGKEYSNEVKIEVNLDPSYIAKMWDDVLVCSNAKEIRFVSWQWYNNGTAIDGATKEYYSNPTIEAGYQVAATTADGHTYFSCPIKGSIKSQSISLKAYPNPSPASESLKIEIEGISDVMLQEATLVVFSTSGVQVMNLSSVSKINEIRLPQGIYVVMLCTGNRSISTKVIRR